MFGRLFFCEVLHASCFMTFFRVESWKTQIFYLFRNFRVPSPEWGWRSLLRAPKTTIFRIFSPWTKIKIKRTFSAVCFSAKSFMTFLDPKALKKSVFPGSRNQTKTAGAGQCINNVTVEMNCFDFRPTKYQGILLAIYKRVRTCL